MAGLTVRVSEAAHRDLRRLADQEGQSMQAILDKAIAAYRERVFWEETNRSFVALRQEPEAWEEEQREREAWDAALLDGLEEQKQ